MFQTCLFVLENKDTFSRFAHFLITFHNFCRSIVIEKKYLKQGAYIYR